MIGSVLRRRYEILRQIGQGGMGCVYEARDRVTDGRVALKVLSHTDKRASASMRTRFFREARASMALGHRNIIRVFDVAVDDTTGVPFMVMEHLEGEDLAHVLWRLHLLVAEAALKIVAQAAAGVEAAHAAGIIHRDIKPANLFLARTGDGTIEVKVLDFGIAKAAVDMPSGEVPTLTRTGHLMGSPLYMSPEQARSSRSLDQRTDIWSLGIVLYRILAGRAPLEECESLGDFIISLCATPPRPVRELAPWVSEEISAVLDRALRLDPSERFASAKLLRDELLALIPGGDDTLRPEMLVTHEGDNIPSVPPSRATQRTLPLGDSSSQSSPMGSTFIHAEQPPSSLIPHMRRTLAVLGFKNLTGRADTAWLSTAFAEMLGAEIAAGEEVRTIPGDEVTRLLTDLGVTPQDSVPRETVQRLGSQLGADFLVAGSYLAMSRSDGLQIRLAAVLHEAASGQPLATVMETASDVDMIALVSRVGVKLSGKMGVAAAEPVASPVPAFPQEPGALQLYAQGLDRLRRLDLGAARDLLQRAIDASPSHPLPRGALAEVWLALGYDERASEAAGAAFERATGLRREDRLFIDGRLHEVRKSWDLAIESFRALYSFFPDDIEYGLRLARAQTNAGKGKDALATIAQLRRLPPPASDDVRIDLAEAAAASSLSDYARELDAAWRAEVQARAQGVRLPLARAKFSQGNALVRLGRPAEAYAPCREARQLFAEAGDRAGEASAVNRLANLAFEAGDLPEAERQFREALQIWEDVGHGFGRARGLNNVADTLLMQGRLREAEALFQKALAVAVEGGDAHNAVLTRANLVELMGRTGRVARARELAAQALESSRATGYRYGLVISLVTLGATLLVAGDVRQAERLLEEALTLSTSMRDRRFTAYSLRMLADVRQAQGELSEARRLYQDALAICREIQYFMDAAENEVALAYVGLNDGQLEGAREMLARARKQFAASHMNESQANATAAAALVALAQGDMEGARAAEEELAPQLTGLENASFRLGGALAVALVESATGRAEQARARAEQARAEAARLELRKIECEADLVVAQLDADAGRLAEAEARRAAVSVTASSLGLELLRRRATNPG